MAIVVMVLYPMASKGQAQNIWVSSVLPFILGKNSIEYILHISPAGHIICKGKFLYSAVTSSQDHSKHFTLTSLTDLFTQTPSRLLWEASSHMLQLMREG